MNKAIAFNRWLTKIINYSIIQSHDTNGYDTFHFPLLSIWRRTWPNYNSETTSLINNISNSIKQMKLKLILKHFHVSRLIHILVLYQQHVKTLPISISPHIVVLTESIPYLLPNKIRFRGPSPISFQTKMYIQYIKHLSYTTHNQYMYFLY